MAETAWLLSVSDGIARRIEPTELAQCTEPGALTPRSDQSALELELVIDDVGANQPFEQTAVAAAAIG
ncbi:MAG: hypothetical protein ABIH03_14220 [Pseudomonadota bacterium]